MYRWDQTPIGTHLSLCHYSFSPIPGKHALCKVTQSNPSNEINNQRSKWLKFIDEGIVGKAGDD